MTVLPQWLKRRADAQRRLRLAQRRVTSEEARKQYERVAKESENRSINGTLSGSLCVNGQR
jgi:hypothetical protein